MKTKWHFSAHPVGIICLLAAVFLMPVRQLMAALLAIALHESAHLLAMRLCGVRGCSIEWTPLGFVAQAEGFGCLPAGKQIWIALSGLLASGVLAAVCRPFVPHSRFGYLFCTANLAILLINAMPVLPLDGGRVILALAGEKKKTVQKCLLSLSYGIAVIITALGLYALWKGIPNLSLMVLGPYLAYAARQSSLQGGVETVQMLRQRAHPQQGIYPLDAWAVIGAADPFSMVKVLRDTPPEKFVLFHTISPESGRMIVSETQQEIIMDFLKNT